MIVQCENLLEAYWKVQCENLPEWHREKLDWRTAMAAGSRMDIVLALDQ